MTERTLTLRQVKVAVDDLWDRIEILDRDAPVVLRVSRDDGDDGDDLVVGGLTSMSFDRGCTDRFALVLDGSDAAEDLPGVSVDDDDPEAG